MEEVETPRRGTRLRVDLLHRSFQGYCGLITGCTTSLEKLVLSSDGRFARSAGTTSTLGSQPGLLQRTAISPPRANGALSSMRSPLQNRPGSYQLAGRRLGSSPMCW
jgi:hypothetical protein